MDHSNRVKLKFKSLLLFVQKMITNANHLKHLKNNFSKMTLKIGLKTQRSDRLIFRPRAYPKQNKEIEGIIQYFGFNLEKTR